MKLTGVKGQKSRVNEYSIDARNKRKYSALRDYNWALKNNDEKLAQKTLKRIERFYSELLVEIKQ